MPSLKKKPVIALDADGVLLDYKIAWGKVYSDHFGVGLSVADPMAFFTTRYWGLESPEPDSPFWKAFSDNDTWAKMPAIPGAIQACHRLKALGYDLVCVTSMPTEFEARRLHNLQSLGFPIDRVLATGKNPNSIKDPTKVSHAPSDDYHAPTHHARNGTYKLSPHAPNPKKEAIEALKPEWFVDDEWRKLRGIEGVNLVLLDPGYSDNPNIHVEHHDLTVQVGGLLEFATWMELQAKATLVKSPYKVQV